MAQQYTLSDIFKHEDTTRQYCISEDSANLSPRQLIELAGMENHFNSNYAEYIIFKRLHQVAEYISCESKKKGYQINVRHNQNIKEDLENNNDSKDYYAFWVDIYERQAFNDDPDIYDIINQAVRDNNWSFLYYLYYKEEEELYDLLSKQKNCLNERKFFVVQ